MAFLPDGGMLVTERPGCLRIVRGGALDPRHVAGLPPIQAAGLAGLMDIALHPQFAQNQLVYFTYHKPAATTTVAALNPTGPCTPVQSDGRGANAAAPALAAGTPEMPPPRPLAVPMLPRPRPRLLPQVAAVAAGRGRSRSRAGDGTARGSST